MDLDTLLCGICYCTYDQVDKTPRIISNCGHTVCSECLYKILNINPNSQRNRSSNRRTSQRRAEDLEEDIPDEEFLSHESDSVSELEDHFDSGSDGFSMRCPFDKIPISRNPQQHPVNYALMQLLEGKNPSAGVCPTHRQKLRFVCLCNKSKVCHDCIIFGTHKGHEARLLTDIAEEAELKQKRLEALVYRKEQHEREISKVIEDKQTCLLKGMKDKFTSIKSILNSKEFEISARINGILGAEQKRIEELLQLNPMLESDLETKSNKYQQMLQKQQYLSVLEDDLSLLKSQVDESLLSKRLTTYEEQMKKVPDFEEFFFNSLNPLIPKIESSIDHIITDNFGKNKKLKTKSSHETKDHTNWIELNSNLSFRVTNKTLVISTTYTSSKALVNLEDWNELNKVTLELAHYYITTTKESLKTLEFICRWARKIPRFEIVFEPRGFAENLFSDILPVILNNPDKIKHIKICLETCKISPKDLLLLFENFMSKMTNLNSLELNLSSTYVTDKCLEVFSEKVLKSIAELRSFALDLSDVYGVSDKGVIPLMIEMESTTSFYLHLQNTRISDDTLNAFADNTLPTMQALKHLTLCLGGTSVGDGSAMTLFNKLTHNLQILTVDLEATNVTDQSVSAFLENFSGFSKALKKLDVCFDDTYVTEKYEKKLNKIRKCYPSNEDE